MIDVLIKSYKDIEKYIKALKIELDLSKNRVETCKSSIKYYHGQLHASEAHDISAINYDSMPHGNFSTISMDRAIDEISKYESMVEVEEHKQESLQKEIDSNEKAKKKIDSVINGMDSLQMKVKFLHEGAHMTLKEIAEKLGYSEINIRRINQQNK